MERFAIIGTAGRDKSKPMNSAHWDWMLGQAIDLIPVGAHVVSGGAAWADHVAVHLFLLKHASEITLHLPAPFIHKRFVGPDKSAASAANYYHEQFGRAIKRDTLYDISRIEHMEKVNGTFEPASAGYAAMFARNAKVAKAENMLAFTFGEGDVPADGGTKQTWDQCKGNRLHVTIPLIV